MDQSRRTELPPPLVAGRLEGIHLPDLLWALCQRRCSGVLRVTTGSASKSLYLEQGRIVFAASSHPDDRLGELFLRTGKINIDQLEQALTHLHTGKRLGTLLVEAGSLTPEQLVEGVLTQVEGIVLDLFLWEEGEYRFDEGPLPTEEVITLGINTGELLIRGIRQIRSFARIRKSVGPPHRIYGLADEYRDLLRGMQLSDGEQMLVEQLKREAVSIDTLCRRVYLSNFELYQTLWGLKVIGAIEQREPERAAPSDVSLEGALSQIDFAELLVRLARGGETGVLYVTRASEERTFHISAGRCTFATSNDPDDGLVAYLLRRGVISLSDREETAKRLLSNKRVGTILRELGVIDERDLKEMVREQLSEIVYDTFRWVDADYAFVPGTLPSVEDITLEENLDTLVAAGLRRITSWSRVWRGCGGFEVALALRPAYLAVLDAMNAGADEWQVVTALKEPRTPRDICRGSDLGDFRVCQILWAMRVLGAVGPVSHAERPLAAADASVSRRVEVEELDVAQDEAQAEAHDFAEPAESAASGGASSAGEVGVADRATTDDATEATVSAPDAAPAVTAGPEPAVDDIAEPEGWPAPPADDVRDRDADSDEPPASVAWTDEAPASEDLDAPQALVEPDVVVHEDRPAEVEAASSEAEPLPDQTQMIPRETLEQALAGTTEDEAAPSPDATQWISAEALAAAQRPRAGEVEGDDDAAPIDTRPEDAPAAEATQAIDQETLDAALAATGESAREPAGPIADGVDTGPIDLDEDAWVPPDDLEHAIARFNSAQRLVYRAVRAEVGAGAANFIRSCYAEFASRTDPWIDGAAIHADGSWDASRLRHAVLDRRVEDPWSALRALIEVQIERVREHLGQPQAAELRDQVDRVVKAGVV